MIVFLAEFSPSVGLGHLSRCLALADALAAKGETCAFLVSPKADASMIPPRHARARVPAGASAAARALRRLGADAFVVDSYALNREWLAALRREIPFVPAYAIDDLGEKASFPVHGFLSFGLGADIRRYPPAARPDSLVGPEFTPLRSAFRRRPARPAFAGRVLVVMGGSDPERQTERAVRVLRGVPEARTVDVVLGPLFGSDTAVRRTIAGDRRFRLRRAPKNLPGLMARADVAVSAAGMAAAELACLGTPAILLALAANQDANGLAAARLGSALFLGSFRGFSDAALARAARRLLGDAALRRRMSAAGRAALDGRGAERLASGLLRLVDAYRRDRFPRAVVRREYDSSSRARHDFQKAKWGSEEGMVNRFRLAVRAIRWNGARAWLDVGCGTGGLLDEVARTRRPPTFTGTDLSPAVIRQARARTRPVPGRFLVAGLGDPVPGAPFDLITSLGVLQKCGIPLRKAAALLADQLAPGGQLFVTTKNRDWRRFDEPGFRPEAGHHWHGLAELRRAFDLAGLKIGRIGGFDPRSGRVVAPRASHDVFIHAKKA